MERWAGSRPRAPDPQTLPALPRAGEDRRPGRGGRHSHQRDDHDVRPPVAVLAHADPQRTRSVRTDVVGCRFLSPSCQNTCVTQPELTPQRERTTTKPWNARSRATYDSATAPTRAAKSTASAASACTIT